MTPKYCVLDSFVDYEGCSTFSKRFLPTVVDIMVIWIKLAYSSPFSLLIPKMSVFILAISYLTTSNFPWFIDLTFQIPIHYYSLQHWILIPSPDTSTTGCCFCFGSISSYFVELLLHWSPVAYWTPTYLGSSSFSVLSFCLHTVLGVLKARILKCFVTPCSSGPCFVRSLHHDPSFLGGPTQHGL